MLVAAIVAVTACGEAPLESIGWRSSGWITEPTVPTTVSVEVATPTFVETHSLSWANDEIVTESLDDPSALLAQVFDRREGDRFIQASREEIAVALPDLNFPRTAPIAAQWISSQLVFSNDGTLADEPSAAFGIWTVEPYTRSRSVAQMIVFRVSTDVEAAAELASGAGDSTCARFSDRSNESCEELGVDDRDTWMLSSASGTTVVWFDGPHRYELFGRSFVSPEALIEMSEEMTPIGSIGDMAS